ALDRPLGNASAIDVPAPGGARLAWEGDGAAVWMTVSDAGRVHLWRFDVPASVPHEPALDAPAALQVTHGDGCAQDFVLAFSGHAAGAGAALILAVNEPLDPSRILRIRRGAPEEVLAAPNAEFLATRRLSRPERFAFTSADGTRVDGWVMRPLDLAPGAKAPAILEIHGGPMAMYGDNFFMEFQVLAANGYAVVYTNPRGSLGYGADFCAAIRARWGEKDYQDLMAGIEEACRRFDFIDPDRLGVAGGSYGGWMVNWIVGHTDRFRAAVTMRSVANRMSAIGTADFGIDRIRQYGPPPWEDPTPYLNQSPLMHAANIRTPLLIEHQEQDDRCPVEQAEQLYAALKYLRREVEFVRYPGESHGMSRTGKPWHRVDRLRRIVAWFDRHLK
ncbi:MAG: S9 family peptidase, partial [Clostridia bacterium]|nr:S9 family peptidase [Clostridia bacterium]